MAVKQDLSKLSVNQLSHITGKSYNTVKRLLSGLDAVDQDGRTLLYSTPDALARIFGAKQESEGDRLNRMRADQIEHELEIKRGEYAPIEVLKYACSDIAGQIHAILEGLPKRIKASMPTLRAREVKIIEREIVKAQNAAAEIQVTFDGPGNRKARKPASKRRTRTAKGR